MQENGALSCRVLATKTMCAECRSSPVRTLYGGRWISVREGGVGAQQMAHRAQ